MANFKRNDVHFSRSLVEVECELQGRILSQKIKYGGLSYFLPKHHSVGLGRCAISFSVRRAYRHQLLDKDFRVRFSRLYSILS